MPDAHQSKRKDAETKARQFKLVGLIVVVVAMVIRDNIAVELAGVFGAFVTGLTFVARKYIDGESANPSVARPPVPPAPVVER